MKSLIYPMISIIVIIYLSYSCGNISIDKEEMKVDINIKKIDTLKSYYVLRFEEPANPCDKILILKKDNKEKILINSIFSKKLEKIPSDIMAPFGTKQVELEKRCIWSKAEYGRKCKPKLFQIIDSLEIVENKMSIFSDLVFVGEYPADAGSAQPD